MKEAFIEKRFHWGSQVLIQQAIEIIDEYEKDNMKLTLRQLYYQFVARGLFDNNKKEYARLGRVITDARMVGLIDWNSIEDKTRTLRGVITHESPGEVLRDAALYFKLNHWEGQENHVEVWIEKEALVGVIERICRQLQVDWFACRGYVSKSEMYKAAKRMNWRKRNGVNTVIIHLGDHDPSGVDMTRDIVDQHGIFDGVSEVIRIALNMDQVRKYNPPPNFAKMKDSRSKDYVKMYGNKSWELDALDPKVIRSLISNAVQEFRDYDQYARILKLEEKHQKTLDHIANNWEDLIKKQEGEDGRE